MSRYLVGIDLGTTHTVVAYCCPPDETVQLFAVEQLVAAGEIAARPLLPSVRYHYAESELSPAQRQLPWSTPTLFNELPPAIMGEFAQHLGSQVCGRLVSSAKSWLSHAGVDRTAPILPWGRDDSVAGISPLQASASYLAYIRAAWLQQFPDAPLEQQDIVLTVPASFDEAARSLTVSAARLAGLPQVRLLEEPQAACYDWLHRHQHQLATQLHDSRLLLVCDVGGGTTDLTLIRIDTEAGEPRLSRIAVGEHLMLGGDNMDLTLAHIAEPRLNLNGQKLSPAQWSQLIQQCRHAKERLLAENAPEQASVTILGSGSRLIGAARSAEFSRAEVQQLLLDGFLPLSDFAELPKRQRSGLVEFGLPYVADAAISRHLAAFLQRHQNVAQAALGREDDAPCLPDAILLNGGVFSSQLVRQRLSQLLTHWRGQSLIELDNTHPELAVARGAVAYALARQGKQPRIGGGSARSYFLVVAEEDQQDQRGVCLLPRGTEEDQPVRLSEHQFALHVGQPVRFHLVSATADQQYHAGELVQLNNNDFHTLPPVATVLAAHDDDPARQQVPVQLETVLTEVGTLALACVAEQPPRRWQLEFQLRGNTAAQFSGLVSDNLHPRFSEAAEQIALFYGARNANAARYNIKTLRIELEKILGKRTEWEVPLLRQLFGALLAGMNRRRRSVDHEKVWFNLAGFCLRPGVGYPLDDWRVEQLWQVYTQGVQYDQAPVWAEWWTLWRRVAGGLPAEAQQEIAESLLIWLTPPPKRAAKKTVETFKRRGHEGMVRLFAVLEQARPADKVAGGAQLLAQIQQDQSNEYLFWALGRLGARVPVQGSAHTVLAPEVVGEWLTVICDLNWQKVKGAALAATLMARLSGDRVRDIDPSLREKVLKRLKTAQVPPSWVTMVSEVTSTDAADEQYIVGEALPPGLKLLT